jgi:hypothetical protein
MNFIENVGPEPDGRPAREEKEKTSDDSANAMPFSSMCNAAMRTKRTNPDFLNGVPELPILSLLSRRPMYGYELVQAIRHSGRLLRFPGRAGRQLTRQDGRTMRYGWRCESLPGTMQTSVTWPHCRRC